MQQSNVSSFGKAKRRSRRRSRGATTVEYVVLLTFVFIPAVAAAIFCFERANTWYRNFVVEVSLPTP